MARMNTNEDREFIFLFVFIRAIRGLFLIQPTAAPWAFSIVDLLGRFHAGKERIAAVLQLLNHRAFLGVAVFVDGDGSSDGLEILSRIDGGRQGFAVGGSGAGHRIKQQIGRIIPQGGHAVGFAVVGVLELLQKFLHLGPVVFLGVVVGKIAAVQRVAGVFQFVGHPAVPADHRRG